MYIYIYICIRYTKKVGIYESYHWYHHDTLWLFNIAMENGPLIEGQQDDTY